MKDKPENEKKVVNNYMRYSGIGFQIAITIGVGIFMGYEIDKWQKTKAPYYTILFATLFMVAAFYLGFRDLLKNK